MTSGQRDTFTLEEDGDELRGEGTWYSVLPGQACPVDIDVRLVADNEYSGSITGNGPCGGNSLGFDCALVDGDERIDCGSDTYRRTD